MSVLNALIKSGALYNARSRPVFLNDVANTLMTLYFGMDREIASLRSRSVCCIQVRSMDEVRVAEMLATEGFSLRSAGHKCIIILKAREYCCSCTVTSPYNIVLTSSPIGEQ